jgi:hypothetical protein
VLVRRCASCIVEDERHERVAGGEEAIMLCLTPPIHARVRFLWSAGHACSGQEHAARRYTRAKV